MANKTGEVLNPFMEMFLGNLEEGFQKVYDYQKLLEKETLNSIEKQQELFSEITSSFSRPEKELENILDQITKNTNEFNHFDSDEANSMLQSWNQQLTDTIKNMQQLSIKPSHSIISLFEQSLKKLNETTKWFATEQYQTQSEAKEFYENMLNLLKETQSDFINLLEKQYKSTFDSSNGNV